MIAFLLVVHAGLVVVETEAEKGFKSQRLVLQVDYESEDGENSGDEDQEEGTEQPEEEVASEEPSEESQGNSPPSVQENVNGGTRKSMRVNKVLQLSSSIETYKYDQQNGLWCEVQSCSLSVLLNNISPSEILLRFCSWRVKVKNKERNQFSLFKAL